jgi:hypothetical protein
MERRTPQTPHASRITFRPPSHCAGGAVKRPGSGAAAATLGKAVGFAVGASVGIADGGGDCRCGAAVGTSDRAALGGDEAVPARTARS